MLEVLAFGSLTPSLKLAVGSSRQDEGYPQTCSNRTLAALLDSPEKLTAPCMQCHAPIYKRSMDWFLQVFWPLTRVAARKPCRDSLGALMLMEMELLTGKSSPHTCYWKTRVLQGKQDQHYSALHVQCRVVSTYMRCEAHDTCSALPCQWQSLDCCRHHEAWRWCHVHSTVSSRCSKALFWAGRAAS